MLTKRDKILIYPWEQRKYEQHQKKVQSALPVIDNAPPKTREHVSVKLKKRQKEIERIAKIETDNLLLLRKMNYIMRTSRVDNTWDKPLPNFLNRVTMYDAQPKKTKTDFLEELETIDDSIKHLRKSKCRACTPKKLPKPLIPEERVPWEPARPPTIRTRSRSLPVRQKSLPAILEQSPAHQVPRKPKSTESRPTMNLMRKHRSFEEHCASPQRLILTRGSLKLCVNFPSDAKIKLQDGASERTLCVSQCCCKSIISGPQRF